MVNIVVGIICCIVGIPLLVCTAVLSYDFISDVLDYRSNGM
jgi:hypothetical protein